MHDTEAKRILDQAHKDVDYRELVEHKDIDGLPGPVREEAISRFMSVTAAMTATLEEHPQFTLQRTLDTPEHYALKALYAAKFGRDMETNIPVSALERSDLLNQALIYLQPILALGLRPDFKEGRAIYDQLVVQVQDVRTTIKTAIKVQTFIQRPQVAIDKTEEEDTDDDESPEDADGDHEADPEVSIDTEG